MPRTKSRKLTPEQRCELQELLDTTSSVKVYRRAKMLLYLDEGYSPKQIRKHTGYAKRAQFFWLRRYRAEGIRGLEDRPRSGRPRTREAPSRRLANMAVLTKAERAVALTPSCVPRCRCHSADRSWAFALIATNFQYLFALSRMSFIG